jgi:hypothetical protein
VRNIILLLSLFQFIFVTSASADIVANLKVNGSLDAKMKPQESALWEFRYKDTDFDEPVHHFMEMHEKLMHTVVISEDFKEFSHVHPTYDHDRHKFSITVNTASTDFDNQDLPNVVQRPGKYFVLASTMPMPPEIMMDHKFDVISEGEAEKVEPLVPELTEGGVFLVKYYNLDGTAGERGAVLEATYKLEMMKWCSWYVPRFLVQLRSWDSTLGDYKDAAEIQPWLGMGAHMVMIGEAGATAMEKKFYHMHSFMPISRAGSFKFPFSDHKNPLPTGVYKIWTQLHFQDKVLKLPLVIKFDPPPFQPNNSEKVSCI